MALELEGMDMDLGVLDQTVVFHTVELRVAKVSATVGQKLLALVELRPRKAVRMGMDLC
jgi:hypothetical protein